jgi:hypothetical protein
LTNSGDFFAPVPAKRNTTLTAPIPTAIPVAFLSPEPTSSAKSSPHTPRNIGGSLARESGLTPRYVRNVFACAFLAPDIVAAILEGHQPLALKFENLYKHIPLSWAEQRQQFGFPQDPSSGQISPAMDRNQGI